MVWLRKTTVFVCFHKTTVSTLHGAQHVSNPGVNCKMSSCQCCVVFLKISKNCFVANCMASAETSAENRKFWTSFYKELSVTCMCKSTYRAANLLKIIMPSAKTLAHGRTRLWFFHNFSISHAYHHRGTDCAKDPVGFGNSCPSSLQYWYDYID